MMSTADCIIFFKTYLKFTRQLKLHIIFLVLKLNQSSWAPWLNHYTTRYFIWIICKKNNNKQQQQKIIIKITRHFQTVVILDVPLIAKCQTWTNDRLFWFRRHISESKLNMFFNALLIFIHSSTHSSINLSNFHKGLDQIIWKNFDKWLSPPKYAIIRDKCITHTPSIFTWNISKTDRNNSSIFKQFFHKRIGDTHPSYLQARGGEKVNSHYRTWIKSNFL